jgi:hypothetical protein
VKKRGKERKEEWTVQRREEGSKFFREERNLRIVYVGKFIFSLEATPVVLCEVIDMWM